MSDRVDWKRFWVYIAFAFGIAWITGLVIFLTGGLVNSLVLAPNVTLAAVLLPTTYMWAPALANIFTRLVTHEGFANAGLRPYFGRGWPYWIAAWWIPTILTIIGSAIFYVIFPVFGSWSIAQAKVGSLWGLVILEIILIPFVNSLFTFGEEFGWRGYMLPKLMPLGPRRAMIVQGLVWGIWHWPVILMGYEYGLKYSGFPWVGMLLFLVFTFSAGVFLAWVTLKGRSVWPAVIGHAFINGTAALSILFLVSQPPVLLGPTPVGIIGMLGYLIFALILFFLPRALTPEAPTRLPFPWKEPEVREEQELPPN